MALPRCLVLLMGSGGQMRVVEGHWGMTVGSF